MLRTLGLTNEAETLYQTMLDRPGDGVDALAVDLAMAPGRVHGCLEELAASRAAIPLGATRTSDPETGLTDTERQLLHLLGSGLTDDTAGQRLGISSRTVNRHMAPVMERLGATSRFEAGIKAAQKGWL